MTIKMIERPSFSIKSLGGSRPSERRVTILGSTGSIGENALRVIERLGDRGRVVALSAHGNTARLLKQIKRYQPEAVSVWEEAAAQGIRKKNIRVHGKPLAVFSGIEGLVELAQWPTANVVLSAVVGGIGLRPLLKALRAGKTVALANKEALIMAGELVTAEAKRWNATLLPVDSEHSAIFQCLQASQAKEVKRLIL